MNHYRFQENKFSLRRGTAKLLQALALMLIVTFAVSAAAEDRAVKSRVAPIYPEIAKRMRASGTVSVEATVDPSGNVTDAKAVDGNRLLAPAAEDAVRKWKFESGSGTAKIKVDINFALSQ
jgi:TonB family protein